MEHYQSFVGHRSVFYPEQFINGFLIFSDKIFDVKGYGLGGQINFEIPINSGGGNTPGLCGFAECIIGTDTGCLRDLLKVVIN